MSKKFNITGSCIPEDHYMVDISAKLTAIQKMIANGEYFVINRPRQYGKTTSIYMLNKSLKTTAEYFPIKISFEEMSAASFKSEDVFIEDFFSLLEKVFKSTGNVGLVNFLKAEPTPKRFIKLGSWITQLVKTIGKKPVLMIDEVDSSSNNQLFLDFLGMLRHKYLNRQEEQTFHSVILAGVHDIKNLTLKIRPEAETKYNSPWNIATEFEVELCFSPTEISSMLEDYAAEKKLVIDCQAIAEKIYYYTSGYPFLVSHVCKIFDEDILPQKTAPEFCLDDIDSAVQSLLKEYNTNVESLTSNLENNPDLYKQVFNLVMNEVKLTFNCHNAVIAKGVLYGVFREERGETKIHNRIYEQLIYDFLAINMVTSGEINLSKYDTRSNYLQKDGRLDMEKVILKFQQFMAEQYAKKDIDFIERNGRLLFLAFIKPIINGSGFDFKEVQVSAEKRLDVVITFNNKKYIIELKIWHGEEYHQQGIDQLCDYLARQNETTGYLLIYDLRKESGQTGKSEWLEAAGKKIFAAWV